MSDLRKAAEQVLRALDGLSEDGICQSSHHANRDRHTALEVCPVYCRFLLATTDLRAALDAPQQAEPQQAESGGPSARWNPWSAAPIKGGA